MVKKDIKQGDVVYVDFSIDSIGSEQNGMRMAIVVQNNCGNKNSSTTVVVPITKQHKKFNLTHYILYKKLYSFLTYDSIVLAEQVKTIDIKRIERICGHIEYYDLQRIIKKINENIKTE